MRNDLDFIGALKSVAEIMNIFKGTNARKDLRLARRSLKKLRRQLKKDGWEEWETEVFNDLTKTYIKQLKKLMLK